MRMVNYSILLITLGYFATQETIIHGQQQTNENELNKNKNKPVQSKANSDTEFLFNNEDLSSEESYFPPIKNLLDNPSVAHGLNSTITAINRSVDTLMDSLFYSLLNQRFTQKLNNNFNFDISTNRKVFSVTDGAYVVIDKFNYGPNYLKKIGSFDSIPINLGAYGYFDIFDIYLRTDGQRISERKKVGNLRYLFNNYFWLLSMLTNILPPSFNPNHMYDPIKLLETPFIFPVNKKRFEGMPIGSIRSYQVSGGVHIPIDFSVLNQMRLTSLLSSLNLKKTLPYSIFIEGIHRINVMRKSNDIAWVGLTNTSKKGHSIAGIIGNTLYLLKNSLHIYPWPGVPLPLYPIDIEISDTYITQKDLLFSFNLKSNESIKAFESAVKGDFVPAFKIISKSSLNNNITYQFVQNKESHVVKNKVMNNFYIINRFANNSQETSEIKLNDQNKEHYIIETSKTIDINHNNVLSGKHNSTIKSITTIDVVRESKKHLDKVNLKNNLLKYKYRLRGKSPYKIQFLLEINQKSLNTIQYKIYQTFLRKLFQLPLNELIDIPLKSSDLITNYKKNTYFSDPETRHFQVHPTPTNIGTINITGSIIFMDHHLKKIINTSLLDKWLAFGEAYDLNKDKVYKMYENEISTVFLSYFNKILVSPLQILNLNFHQIDAYFDIKNVINSLQNISQFHDPEKILNEFSKLINTYHIDKIATAFLILSDLKDVPRKLDFYLNPNNRLDATLQKHFKKVNRITFSSEAKFPSIQKYTIAKNKLHAFNPSYLHNLLKRPKITKLNLKVNNTNNSISPYEIKVLASGMNLKPNKKLKIYIRFQTQGSVSINQRKLGESTFDVANITTASSNLNETQFEFYLSGSNSPVSNFLLEQFLDFGGSFDLAISISQDNDLWSKEKRITFTYEDGEINPVSEN